MSVQSNSPQQDPIYQEITTKFETISAEISIPKIHQTFRERATNAMLGALGKGGTKQETSITYKDLSRITGKGYFWHRATSRIPFNEITKLIGDPKNFDKFTILQKVTIINSYSNMKNQLKGKDGILDRIGKARSKTYQSSADQARVAAEEIIKIQSISIKDKLQKEIDASLEKHREFVTNTLPGLDSEMRDLKLALDGATIKQEQTILRLANEKLQQYTDDGEKHDSHAEEQLKNIRSEIFIITSKITKLDNKISQREVLSDEYTTRSNTLASFTLASLQ